MVRLVTLSWTHFSGNVMEVAERPGNHYAAVVTYKLRDWSMKYGVFRRLSDGVWTCVEYYGSWLKAVELAEFMTQHENGPRSASRDMKLLERWSSLQ